MKNRKTVVVAFLLVAAMLLGVGYATLTDTLTITGDLGAGTSVSQTEFDTDVYFSSTNVVTDDTGNQAASQILEGRDDAKITANHFTVKDQKVVVKYVIANDSTEFDALIDPTVQQVIVDNGADHDPVFSVVWEWDELGSNDTAEATIAAGGTKDLYVTITLIETPTDDHTGTFEITYNATAVDATAVPVE